MARPKNIRGKGSGWHKQRVRHSNARKYGRAGGTYASNYPKQLPIYKIKGKFYFRDIRLGEYRNIKNPFDRMLIGKVNLSDLQKPTKADKEKVFGKDTDKDGVPDKYDCEPLNPKKQDTNNQLIEGLKKVNPMLFRKAQSSKSLDEFLKKMGTPDKVDYSVLTDFYNRVKKVKPITYEEDKDGKSKKDSDGDGVPDKLDCEPYNPKKQDTYKKVDETEWRFKNRFIRATYDDELEPPSWIVQQGYIDKDNALVVEDSDLASSKKEAIKFAKERVAKKNNPKKQDKNWERIAGGYEVNKKTGEVRATPKYGIFGKTQKGAIERIMKEQVRMGVKVEREHQASLKLNDKEVLQIAIDHLKEDPEYYTKLKLMESKKKA